VAGTSKVARRVAFVNLEPNRSAGGRDNVVGESRDADHPDEERL
jgi:hypothetical protein